MYVERVGDRTYLNRLRGVRVWHEAAGWFWCAPDGPAHGPFRTLTDARYDAAEAVAV